jgi:hypothetical protein
VPGLESFDQAVVSTMPAVELSGMGKLKVLAPTAA